MKEALNRKNIVVTEGYCFLDGKRIYDAVKFKLTFTPRVKTSRVLGSKTQDTRWNGYDLTVEMTRRRTTKWAKEVVQNYINKGITPEFTVSGVMDDKDSDYYEAYGSETVTAVGCVLTSAINVMELDAEGEYFDDVLTFNAKDVKFK